tara:strand:+ start:82 stop:339 length:258 start_codon:yes stop_codon:yes gene_type:complete
MSTQETKIVHIDCTPTVDRLRYTDTPSRTWTAEDEARRIVKAGCNYSDVAEVMLGLLCELEKARGNYPHVRVKEGYQQIKSPTQP